MICSPPCAIFIIILLLMWESNNYAFGHQATSCTPANSTALTGCTAGHWINVRQVLYAPRRAGTPNCEMNLTSCNYFVNDIGLQTICNGPVEDELKPCREEIHVKDAARASLNSCLETYTDIAVMVKYDCIPDTSVIDICSGVSENSDQVLYLASPGYPTSHGEGQTCKCEIRGNKLRMEAIELNVRAKFPWSRSTNKNTDNFPDAVVLIEKEGNSLFHSSSDCANCEQFELHNTVLSFSEQLVSNITASYSDFGLNGQNAWLKVRSLESRINISCSSSPLPPERIITTTTTVTTAQTLPTSTPTSPQSALTTETTLATISSTTEETLINQATPTTTTSTTTTSTTEEMLINQATPTTTTSTTTTSTTTTSTTEETLINQATPTTKVVNTTSQLPIGNGATTSTETKITGSSSDSDENDDDAVTVVLVLLLIILVVVGVVLGMFIYRRKDKLDTSAFRPACVKWIQRALGSRKRPYKGPEDEEHYEVHTFENSLYGQVDVHSNDRSRNQNTRKSTSMSAHGNINANDLAGDAQHHANEEVAFGADKNISACNFKPMLDPVIQASHQQLVEQEVTRIKLERSLRPSDIRPKQSQDERRQSSRQMTSSKPALTDKTHRESY